jgi:hypothetical protein
MKSKCTERQETKNMNVKKGVGWAWKGRWWEEYLSARNSAAMK